jgi:hypothetical protein
MAYLGNTPTTQSFISGTDYFNGNGSTTAFTLSRTVASVNDIQAVVNNVVQVPNDAYTISGTTITFTSAPSSGTNNVYVRYLSTTTQAITPSQNTVSWSTLDSNVQGDLGISGKNRIINGNMVIDQRNAGASVNTSNAYPVDRFQYQNDSDATVTLQQSSTAPAGFSNSLQVTVSTADASVGAAQYSMITQRIEGYNIADFNWGSANAKTVTLSFWVQSSVTGTYGGVLNNNGSARSYPFTYAINAANTWEYKTITIVGDQSGTWNTTNSSGIQLRWTFGCGSTYAGTAGSWSTNTYFGATGTTNLISTLNATWYITGVQLEVGTQATTFTTAGGSYGAELALCQRYCINYKSSDAGVYMRYGSGYANSATNLEINVHFPVTMRTNPSLTVTSTASNYGIYVAGGVNACSTVPALDSSSDNPSVSTVNATTASSFSSSGGGSILSNNNTTSYMLFTAEL